MASVERGRLLPAVDHCSQHIGRHAPETLADEAVEEEVDTGVEQCQHVGQISEHVQQSAGTLRGWRRGIEVVEDHEGTGGPQNSKNGGDGEENGSGLAGGVAAETEAAAASAQLPNNDGVEGEEDSAGEEVNGGTVGPHQHMLGHGSPVTLFSSSSSSSSTTSHPRQAVPQLRPPVIRSCREQAPDIHSKYHSSCAGWVGDRMVAQRVANSDVAVNGERHGDPDGGVDGGELQNLHCIV